MFEPLPDDAAAVVETERHVKQQSTDADYRGVGGCPRKEKQRQTISLLSLREFE
jgi:hypothetical protein